jgi:ADP-glucose type glycogen/starch synthase
MDSFVDFTNSCYPLGVQCGRRAWQEANLNAGFARTPRPERTFFRHLLADHLRTTATGGMSAAELEVWASLNAALRFLADDFLSRRQFRWRQGRIEVAGSRIDLELKPLLQGYLELFPAVAVELRQLDYPELIQRLEERDELKELLLELVLLQVQSHNPALQDAQTLFNQEEQQLQQRSKYRQRLQEFDQALPELDDGYSGRPQSLLARLMEPLRKGNSLYEQLRQVQELWADILPEALRQRITAAFSQYESEGSQPGIPGEPETVALEPAAFMNTEYAAFTADLDWMPRTVLLAKSTYVWLEQLSRKYHRPVKTLDQIPDAELDELVASGFTSLWLIGIWQRSKASLKVKQLCGQMQVAASAYAIDDYRIAADIGGDAAFDNLHGRCRARGIDLACDVVTNHTGIESALMREHPDWFIQQPHPPYPGYRFTGPDLSEDPNYAMQIENGYYDHSEAAVVCRYQHRTSGEVRYIFHGNDGTHLPWNDTAQLNYLLPQVREAMIRLVIDVARRFRIIRFDAAMTLAKKHFQRLWFPLPGGGAGVPSRQDHALSREEFEHYFPVEFWRELVDRISREAPDTLLVAEAFWLMEGYFVRTLGMHRVYNSAFMNMLKREENAKYRQTLKNILAFDTAILQRFVNFMSNPDEKPAIEQFGNGDKYFCVATMLATMPGLPMFGHGQLEGFKEKYGMEYLSPRWDEVVDQDLIARHRREIFPLLRQRALFSGAEQFQLYDFISNYGVEEDVFVYSNRLAERSVLVLCNNSPNAIAGRIGAPVPMADREGIDFLQACALPRTGGDFVLGNDISTGLQYLQPLADLAQGGDFQLQPYARRVLGEFATLADSDGRWAELWQRHGDQGQANLQLLHDALLLETVFEPAAELLALPSPERTKKAVDRPLEQLATLFAEPAVAALESDYLLTVLLHQSFPGTPGIVAAAQELAALLRRFGPLTDEQFFRLLDRFFNERRLRPLLGCHYYDHVDWFSRELFAALCRVLLLHQVLLGCRAEQQEPRGLRERTIPLLKRLNRARRLAEKINYQGDGLLRQLDPSAPSAKLIPAEPREGMKILFVASEATPFAKTGGLADVAGSLPRALRELGHDVQVMLPCYRVVEDSGFALHKTAKSVEIRLQAQAYRGSLKRAVHEGVPYWLVDTPEFFDRDQLYATAEGDYPDNGLRFGFFCRAVLEAAKLLDFQPDLIHLHDWQTGLLPVLLKTSYANQDFFKNTRSLLTIHNLGYQGMFPLDLLRQLELPASLASPAGMEYYGRLSMLKGAIVHADLINTVSPTYGNEIQVPEQGHGFDGLLRERSAHLVGILNGLDVESWNPQSDPLLPHTYSAGQLSGKNACKRALQNELGLDPQAETPLVAVISRLDWQKGIDLIEAIWPQLLERKLQFVLLGSGSRAEMQFWRQQQALHPGRVAINLIFDEGLSHRLYAAADLLLVPSRYEPCGLTQMIALRYGALPVVRRTGGLADTVTDVTVNPAQGNGFVFEQPVAEQLLTAIDRGLDLYAQQRRWTATVKRGMRHDFSWRQSAARYGELYAGLVADKGATGAGKMEV